jgi:hypothetical protein
VFVSRDGGELIKCYRCGEFRPADAFAWRRRHIGQRDSFCRPCRAAYKREHYLANRQRYVDQARENKQRLALERTAYLVEYFFEHPCRDCGETDPMVLEFDHQRDKCFDIAAGLPYRNWASILAEIEKCEVACANCHRRRTARQRGWVRAVLLADDDNSTDEAGDENRTRTLTLEGSRAAATPHPRKPEA